jgi:hypothetical protein
MRALARTAFTGHGFTGDQEIRRNLSQEEKKYLLISCSPVEP